MPYVFATASAFLLFVFAGWRIRQNHVYAAPAGPFMRAADPPPDLNAGASPAEVNASLSLALKRLLPVMTRRGVRAEVAVRPGLWVPLSAGGLADLLEELLAAAIHQAVADRLLVTAVVDGGQIHIGVTDDDAGADPDARAAHAQRLAERAALFGGTLDLEVRPGQGTTMTLRLAALNKTAAVSFDTTR